MADNPRRPVVGSRNPTGRPRRIAGQRPDESALEPLETADAPVVEPVETKTKKARKPRKVKVAKEPRPERTHRVLGSRRTTVVLAAVLVLLVAGASVEAYYLLHDDTPTVSAKRPVVVGDATVGEAVETAANSTAAILSTTYQDYDGQIDEATKKMTDTFAAQYRQTADGIKDQFIAQQTKLQVKAVAQGVVQASPSQVQVLLFLNQYVQKVENGKPKTGFAQYRALVTVVHTDHGWLVSNIETK